MAEGRRRVPTTLTLDPRTRSEVSELLAQLPVKVSLSSLVNELLTEWAETVGPHLVTALSGTADDRLAAMHRATGAAIERMGSGMAEVTRALKEQQEPEKE